jgi:hypothetical protein
VLWYCSDTFLELAITFISKQLMKHMPGDQPQRGSGPKKISRSLAVRMAFFVILVIVVLWNIDVPSVARFLTARLWYSMILIQPLVLTAYVFLALRFSLLVKTPPAPFVPTLKAIFLAFGMNMVIPGRISELLKATYLKDHAGIPMSAGLAAILLERMADVMMLALLALLSISFFLVDISPGIAIALIIVPIVAVVLLMRSERYFLKLISLLPWEPVRGFLERFLSHTVEHLKQGTFYKALLLSGAVWLTDFVFVALFIKAAGSIPVSLLGVLMVIVAIAIGAAIPALPGGLGTYEAAAVFALKGVGYSFEEALALGIALHISVVFLAIVAALIILMTEHIGIATVFRQIIDAAKSEKV